MRNPDDNMTESHDSDAWWSDYHRLVEAWQRRREAIGGVSALAGFAFQLSASLLLMARAVPGASRPRVFVESLSDLVAIEGISIVVTQAKRTLRSDTLRSALEELWSIDALAHEVVPSLTQRLRYQILASRRELADIERSVSRWQPTISPSSTQVLDAFKMNIQVKIQGDSVGELATHLVNAFGHSSPFEQIDQWVGRLLLAHDFESIERAARVISTEIDALSAAARLVERKFYLWQGKDRSPTAVIRVGDGEKPTLVGELPDVEDLRKGRFAPRAVFKCIHSAIEDWVSTRTKSRSPTLPVFWISGRSGTGKSIALLHMLAELHHSDQNRVIIWLKGRSDRMAEAMRWARPFFTFGYQVILAVDDPYTTQRQVGFSELLDDVLTELSSLHEEAPSIPSPIMICCGPSEQREDFIEDLVDQVEVTTYSLPHETTDEIEALRQWYHARTGDEDLPVGEAKDTLMVQLFFEWRTGQPLAAFARRFKQRLIEVLAGNNALLDLLAEILALNRLYALYPSSALDSAFAANPRLEAGYRRLTDEEHHLTFVVGSAGVTTGDALGVRLTHPHLADAIYVAWFGRVVADQPFRRFHLRNAISAALDSRAAPSIRFAPLWSIVRLVRRNDSLLSAKRLDLIRPELKTVLSELYAHYHSRVDGMLTDLPIWVDLDRRFDLNLSPSPLEGLAIGVASAGNHSQGLRLACHKLLEHGDAHHTIIVAALLNRIPDWQEWGPVALDLIHRNSIALIANSLRLYLLHRFTSISARRIVGLLLRMDRNTEPLAETFILTWLTTAPVADPMWPATYTDLVDQFGVCAESEKLGLHFLDKCATHGSWSHVWERLWRQSSTIERDALALQARQWLRVANSSISGWTFVWEHVWEASGKQDDELGRIGQAWLREQLNHPSWSFVWEPMWAATGEQDEGARTRRDELTFIGRAWLREQPNHPSWSFVWTPIWEAAGKQDDELDCIGREWLRTQLDADAWASVLAELWKAASNQEAELVKIAHAWLAHVGVNHRSRRFVLHTLGEHSKEALTSLNNAPNQADVEITSEGWPFWWADSIVEVPLSEQPKWITPALTWLQGHHFRTNGWVLVWRRLWDLSLLPRSQLVAVAEEAMPPELNSRGSTFVRSVIAKWQAADDPER